jgi:hypothetical protein
MDRAAFAGNGLTRDAAERCMERVCEAAHRLGERAAELMPHQPWTDIRGVATPVQKHAAQARLPSAILEPAPEPRETNCIACAPSGVEWRSLRRPIPMSWCTNAVERFFAWLSRYRRLNTIFERSKEHLLAFVAIAFISILAQRLKRLVAEDLSAWHLQTDT